MTGQPGNLPPAEPGQAQNASQGGEPQAGAASQYLTREEALRLIETEFTRKGQSIADRTTARVQKVLDAARQQGLTMTPQQAQLLLDATADATQPQPKAQNQAAPQPGQPGQPAAAQPPTQPPTVTDLDPVSAKAVAILKDEFQLTDFDPNNLDPEQPEFKLLDLETTDPEKFLASVRVYGKAVAEKKAAAGDASHLPSLGSKGGPAPNAPYANKRGSEVLDDYYRTHPIT